MSSASDGQCSDLTEYEKMRLSRIKRNQAFLESLGLGSAVDRMREAGRREKKVRKAKVVDADFVRRSSGRLEGKNYNFSEDEVSKN